MLSLSDNNNSDRESEDDRNREEPKPVLSRRLTDDAGMNGRDDADDDATWRREYCGEVTNAGLRQEVERAEVTANEPESAEANRRNACPCNQLKIRHRSHMPATLISPTCLSLKVHLLFVVAPEANLSKARRYTNWESVTGRNTANRSRYR